MDRNNTSDKNNTNTNYNNNTTNNIKDNNIKDTTNIENIKKTAFVVVGLAGSGKSTFTHKLYNTLSKHLQYNINNNLNINNLDNNNKNINNKSNLNKLKLDINMETGLPSDLFAVNLDANASTFYTPYPLNYDIRDYVDYEETMQRYRLGPNGGAMMCMNLFIGRIDTFINKLYKSNLNNINKSNINNLNKSNTKDNINKDNLNLNNLNSKSTPRYIILDTPGQIEIFTQSVAPQILFDVLRSLGYGIKIMYVVDSVDPVDSVDGAQNNINISNTNIKNNNINNINIKNYGKASNFLCNMFYGLAVKNSLKLNLKENIKNINNTKYNNIKNTKDIKNNIRDNLNYDEFYCILNKMDLIINTKLNNTITNELNNISNSKLNTKDLENNNILDVRDYLNNYDLFMEALKNEATPNSHNLENLENSQNKNNYSLSNNLDILINMANHFEDIIKELNYLYISSIKNIEVYDRELYKLF